MRLRPAGLYVAEQTSSLSLWAPQPSCIATAARTGSTETSSAASTSTCWTSCLEVREWIRASSHMLRETGKLCRKLGVLYTRLQSAHSSTTNTAYHIVSLILFQGCSRSCLLLLCSSIVCGVSRAMLGCCTRVLTPSLNFLAYALSRSLSNTTHD